MKVTEISQPYGTQAELIKPQQTLTISHMNIKDRHTWITNLYKMLVSS